MLAKWYKGSFQRLLNRSVEVLAMAGVVFFATACTRKTTPTASAKLFALNPQEFENVPMLLSGKVASRGPGGAYFILEDDSGKVFVATQNTSDSFDCPEGATASLEGRLAKLESESSYYFAMEKLKECRR